jgi:hypothetical protein
VAAWVRFVTAAAPEIVFGIFMNICAL